MTTQEQYIRMLNRRLAESRSIIDEISTHPDFAHAREQRDMEEEIERLQARERAVKEKLEQLEQAGEHAFERLKDSIEEALTHLDEAVESARSKLRR